MECQLFGQFGDLVQFALAVTSASILFVKRFCENPRRSWKVWFLDSFKQGFAALIAHLINLELALAISRSRASDACVWYLISVMLDTTIGMAIAWCFLMLFERLVLLKGWKLLKSGNYGSSNHTSYWAWAAQVVIWTSIVSLAKLVLGGIQYIAAEPLEALGVGLTAPLRPFPRAELIIVMIIVPVTMNAFQFWVQDGFLKFNSGRVVHRLTKLIPALSFKKLRSDRDIVFTVQPQDSKVSSIDAVVDGFEVEVPKSEALDLFTIGMHRHYIRAAADDDSDEDNEQLDANKQTQQPLGEHLA